MVILLFLSIFSIDALLGNAEIYSFYDEPIDVVIPCAEKDLLTLNSCISGIRTYGKNVRRVIVISDCKMTEEAEWFDEKNYPFSQEDLELVLPHSAKEAGRIGWFYQQLLKYYAPFVIPDISSNVLVLDADTIFLNKVEFLNSHFGGLYNTGVEYHPPYFRHAEKLLPEIRRLWPEYSGISHHMLFQRSILTDLFSRVENYHQMPLWQAFCKCVDAKDVICGASEFEIYFNFAFSKTSEINLQHLKWENVVSMDHLQDFQRKGYHFVSCHKYIEPALDRHKDEEKTLVFANRRRRRTH